MKKRLFASCFLVVAALIASGLWATRATSPSPSDKGTETSMVGRADLKLEEMARQSDLILTGRCTDTSSTWIQDGRVLVTLATVSVDEVIKGGQASTVTVVLPGGVDLNRKIPVAMTYPGAPRIAPQEEVFLFLTGEDAVPNSYTVAGFSEGKFSIVEGEAGQKLISRDPIMMREKRGPGVKRGNRQFTPLSDFKQKVRRYLGQ
ncbi:MAG TPA: hypothetical protein VNO14_14880 [Blastocatellia bacterium]|nr:hypothetical protein [Blastocatellia bacterium]